MTQFLPTGIFSAFVLRPGYCEKSSLVYMSLSVKRADSHASQKSKVGFRFLVFSKISLFLLLLSLSLLAQISCFGSPFALLFVPYACLWQG